MHMERHYDKINCFPYIMMQSVRYRMLNVITSSPWRIIFGQLPKKELEIDILALK